MADNNIPNLIEGDLDDLRAKTSYRIQFRNWRILRHDDRTRNPSLPCLPGQRLSHVSSTNSVDAASLCLGPGQSQRVARPSNLERTSGLKVLQLQIDVQIRIRVQPDQGSAKNRARKSGLSPSNLLQRNRASNPSI